MNKRPRHKLFFVSSIAMNSKKPPFRQQHEPSTFINIPLSRDKTAIPHYSLLCVESNAEVKACLSFATTPGKMQSKDAAVMPFRCNKDWNIVPKQKKKKPVRNKRKMKNAAEC